MKLKLTAIGILVLVYGNLFSQIKFQGTIYDRADKKPLIGAAVYIKESREGTVTDANGHYVLNLSPGDYHVEISYVGYTSMLEPISISRKNIARDFYLTASAEKLDEVVVQAKGKIQQTRELPFQVSVLDAKPLQIQSQPVTGLVNQISGVRVREDGGMGSNAQIMLNGIGGKGIRIFVDGIPADLLGNGMAINNIPVNMIQHIEVYKGVIPAKFGSDALGGIINLVTHDVKKDYLDISTGAGSFGTCQASLNSRKYLGKERKMYFGLSGFYNHSDNDYWMDDVEIRTDNLGNTETGSVRRFNDAYTSYLAQVTSGFRNLGWADEIQLHLSAAHTYKEWQHGQSAEQPWGETFSEETDINSEIKWKKLRMWDGKLDASLNAGYNYTDYSFIDTASRTYYWGAYEGIAQYTGSDPGETGYYKDGRNPVLHKHNTFTRLNFVWRLQENQELNFTALYTGVHIHGHDERGIASFGSDILANPQNMDRWYAGLDLESKFWGKRLTNVLSAKNFSGHSKVVVISETNLADGEAQNSYARWGYGDAVKIQLFPVLTATVNYEYTYRLPDKEELFGNFITVFPNAELEPEESQNIDVGLRYKPSGRKLTADVNGFYRHTSNLIFLNALSLFRSVYMNLLATETWGAEGEIRYAPVERLSLYANLTCQDICLKEVDPDSDIDDRYIGAHIPNTPWLFGNTGMRFTLPWHPGKSDKILVFYTCNYVHDFYLTWEIDGKKSTKATIPQQIVHNGGVSYIFLKDKLSLTFESRNVTDEKVYDNYRVQKPGRSFYAKLRVFLDK